MVQCEECQMWRLIYSKYKLTKVERETLQNTLDNVVYTCGAQLQDLGLSDRLREVYARDISCYEPIERLYYSVGTYQPICIHCASEEALNEEDDCYPQCSECSEKEPIKKRK